MTEDWKDSRSWYTQVGTLIANDYIRVVHGGRGTYMEFARDHMIWNNLVIPKKQLYRTKEPWKSRVYYIEWRSRDASNIKVYDQLKETDYADYKVGLLYISPNDLVSEWTIKRLQ